MDEFNEERLHPVRYQSRELTEPPISSRLFLMKLLLFLLFASSPAWATWTLVHANAATTNCSGSTCGAVLTSTTAGNLLVIGYFGANSVTVSSINAGGTFVHCPSCAVGASGTSGFIDAGYVLSATGSVTAITVTLSGSGGAWATIVSEFKSDAGTAIYDTSLTKTDTTCTSCATPALTLTGANDLVVELAAAGQSITTPFIGSPYTNPSIQPNGDGWAGALNVTSFSAPSWTQSPTGVLSGAAIAFKEVSAGGPPPGQFPRVN